MQPFNRLKESTRDLRMYAGSDVSKQAIAVLDALYDCYCQDLIDVAPDGLVRLQAAIKQVTYLRNVFANDGLDIPKI